MTKEVSVVSETEQMQRKSQLLCWLDSEALWADELDILLAKVQWLQLVQQLPQQADRQQQFEAVLQLFYHKALFTVPQRELTVSRLAAPALLHQAILQREADPLLLTMLLAELLSLAGFEVQPVWCEQQLLLQLHWSVAEKVWLQPLTGQWQIRLKPENGLAQPLSVEMKLMPTTVEQLVQQLWQQQKQLFLLSGQQEHALAIVQFLLQQQPDDPYLRRERALILELLDHWSLAIADYQYFLEQRPDDPMSEHIQQQIRQLSCQLQSVH